MLNVEDFVARVAERLPALADEADRPILTLGIQQMHRRGYTVDDAVAHCLCLQEVDPALDEDVALRRIARIRVKYSESV